MPAETEPVLALLKADHNKVTELFQRCAGLADQDPLKLALARQMCLDLKVHTVLEEELFYPVLQGTGGGFQG
jgi:Hemerythrin HHE cation binding domain